MYGVDAADGGEVAPHRDPQALQWQRRGARHGYLPDCRYRDTGRLIPTASNRRADARSRDGSVAREVVNAYHRPVVLV